MSRQPVSCCCEYSFSIELAEEETSSGGLSLGAFLCEGERGDDV
ncbi:hypothetical protein [Salipaludibacillus aurantiacus]|nr:hypothetical protein [Salipaludibacillus aurantiacus]